MKAVTSYRAQSNPWSLTLCRLQATHFNPIVLGLFVLVMQKPRFLLATTPVSIPPTPISLAFLFSFAPSSSCKFAELFPESLCLERKG